LADVAMVYGVDPISLAASILENAGATAAAGATL
jgi:hypothetical protein